jgi:hypothetical protein
MPGSPAWILRAAGAVAGLYRTAERRLLRLLAGRLGAESPSPADVGAVRREASRVADELAAQARERVASAVRDAYRQGASEVGEGAREVPVMVAERLADEVTARLDATHEALPRWAADTYQRVIAEASARVADGSMTRRQASQLALDRFADQGVTGYVDRSGRRWTLESYSEMAVRTATAQAALQGTLDRLRLSGHDLVVVSLSPRPCPRCSPWQGHVLSISGLARGEVTRPSQVGGPPVTVHVAGSVAEARAAGLWHPSCFPGDVLVSAPSGIGAADARWYEGELVVIHTAAGNELPVTPNHPILTPEGWVAAGALKVGQCILRHDGGVERMDGVRPGHKQVPTRIREIFHALREASKVPTVRVPVTAEQFHGDGVVDTEVEVVLADGLLEHDGNIAQRGGDGAFLAGDVGLDALLAESALDQLFLGSLRPTNGVMGGGRQLGSLLHGHPLCPTHSSLAPADAGVAGEELSADGSLVKAQAVADLLLRQPLLVEAHSLIDPGRSGASLGAELRGLGGSPHDSGLTEADIETGRADADGGRDLARTLAGAVTADGISEIEVRQFAGYVYNLQSGDGWYLAEGIVARNCTHTVAAWLAGATRIQPVPVDPALYVAKERQRELERHVRRWKRRSAAAMDDLARRRAEAKVRAYQAALREHVAANDLKRQSAREQIGKAI